MVWQTGYGLYPRSLLRRKIIFSSHLQLLSTSAKIELRATVEPQGARSVPQMWRIAATHEASAFCLPWNRTEKTAGRMGPVNHGSLLRPRRGSIPCNRTVCVLAVPVKLLDRGVENQTGLFRRCFPCRRFIRRRSPLGRRALQSAKHPE